jgi:hypothetical protein
MVKVTIIQSRSAFDAEKKVANDFVAECRFCSSLFNNDEVFLLSSCCLEDCVAVFLCLLLRLELISGEEEEKDLFGDSGCSSWFVLCP